MGKRPDYHVFVGVKTTRGDGLAYLRAGVGWTRNSEQTGKEFISCKLDLIPVGEWDGSFILHPFREESSDGQPF